LRDVFDGGEIRRGVTCADAAFVVSEDHIHDPIQAVFDSSMVADDGGELRSMAV